MTATVADIPQPVTPDSPFRRVARKFFRDRLALAATAVIVLFFAVATVAGIKEH